MKHPRALLLIFAAFPVLLSPLSAQTPDAASWTAELVNTVRVIPNITYSTASNVELKLDLYLPRNAAGPVPVVLYLHGGGWVAGSKEGAVMLVMPYIQKGWAAANVEYRLARVALAPAAVEDCRAALRWVYVHAREHLLDTTRIIVTGHSAGGHLALMTGMLPPISEFDRVPEWAQEDKPLRVAAIINWYGIADVEDLLAGPNKQNYAISWLGSLANREEVARRVSPLSYVRRGLPPVLTVHGDADPLVPYRHATRLHEALAAAEVPNRLVTIKNGRHGGFSREEIQDIYRQIDEFLREHVTR